MRQVPLIRKIVYEANSTDYLSYKRQKTEAKSSEQLAAEDYAI